MHFESNSVIMRDNAGVLNRLSLLKVPALESAEQGGVSNHTEAAIIHMLLSVLIKVHV